MTQRRPRHLHVAEIMTDNLAQIVLRHSYPQITCYVVVDSGGAKASGVSSAAKATHQVENIRPESAYACFRSL